MKSYSAVPVSSAMACWNYLIEGEGLAGPGDKGQLVSGIDKRKLAGHQIQHPLERGDEQPLAVGLAQDVVDLGEHPAQICAGLGVVLNQRLADNHKQRRRHPLAGHIGHDNGQVALFHHKEIVEVAPTALAGFMVA